MTLIVDPPSGWKYGFPKPVHEEYYLLENDFNMISWLVSEGYPQAEIDKLGSSFFIRTWEEIDTVEEINKTYKKGYNEGYVEGYDEGYQKGYEDGANNFWNKSR